MIDRTDRVGFLWKTPFSGVSSRRPRGLHRGTASASQNQGRRAISGVSPAARAGAPASPQATSQLASIW